MDFLNEPAKVWHLLVVAAFFVMGVAELRKQISAIGTGMIRILKRIDPPSTWDGL